MNYLLICLKVAINPGMTELRPSHFCLITKNNKLIYSQGRWPVFSVILLLTATVLLVMGIIQMKKKTSTKKPTNTSSLDLQVPETDIDKAPESAMQADMSEPLTMFDVLQRRMAREAK